MKKWWRREVLRFVDAWACREGTPEDDEDAAVKRDHATQGESTLDYASGGGILQGHAGRHMRSTGSETCFTTNRLGGSHPDLAEQRAWATTHDDMNREWIELERRAMNDEERGHD